MSKAVPQKKGSLSNFINSLLFISKPGKPLEEKRLEPNFILNKISANSLALIIFLSEL